MNNLTLDLDIDETNLVLEALGQLPFVRVYRLISRIQQQAQQQIPAPPAASEATS
jgi:hypothetical protein